MAEVQALELTSVASQPHSKVAGSKVEELGLEPLLAYRMPILQVAA